jgi:Mrp family chromosome partitioning ATPase
MTFMRDRTYFDPQSGSIIDLPEKMWPKAAEPVSMISALEVEDEHAEHRYGEKWNRPGEYAAYRERVEAQFSAPVPQNGDTQRAVSIVVSGFPASGKSAIGRLIAKALLQSGIEVRVMGQRAVSGVCEMKGDSATLASATTSLASIAQVRPNQEREAQSVELWEIDRAAPHNH